MNVMCGRRLAQRLEEARSGLWQALEQHHALATVALREMTKKKLRLRRREMLLHQQLLHSQFDLQAAFETHFNEADREMHTEWQRMYSAQIDKLRTFMAQLQAHIDKVGDDDLAKTVNRLQARSDAMASAGEIAQARRWENPCVASIVSSSPSSSSSPVTSPSSSTVTATTQCNATRLEGATLHTVTSSRTRSATRRSSASTYRTLGVFFYVPLNFTRIMLTI